MKEENNKKTEVVIEANDETVIAKPKTTLAKAGKRSAKAVEEVKAKETKELKKANSEDSEKPKQTIKPTRTLLERRGKNYKKVAEKVEKNKAYPIDEAIKLVLETSNTKFDSTVEFHMNLNVDPKYADQNIRDSIILPSGTGKTVRVAVFADGKEAEDAKKAGADIVGMDDFIKLLDKEKLDFDILISTPTLMAKLGKYARLLGPKGLMPNPKSGTVTMDVAKAVTQSKAGKVEYRVDSTGIVHLGIGKVSFGDSKVRDNLNAVVSNIKSNKPNSIKGAYIKGLFLSTSMGPSVQVDISTL